jgi:phosphoserine phosphatase RsbU/P
VVPGLDMAARSTPSRTVGGDFFEVQRVNDTTIALAIADVSGKGLPSALLVSTVQASLKVYLELGLPLTELVSKLNRLIYFNSTTEKFITFVLCLYDIPSRTIRFVNAGHNYPFIIRASGGFDQLDRGGTCLGFFEDSTYEEGSFIVNPGDVLILYTDGVTEAMNKRGDLFGEARLYSTISNQIADDARSIESGLLENIRLFSAGTTQGDDITTVIMKLRPIA